MDTLERMIDLYCEEQEEGKIPENMIFEEWIDYSGRRKEYREYLATLPKEPCWDDPIFFDRSLDTINVDKPKAP